jgi:hypothetical protein
MGDVVIMRGETRNEGENTSFKDNNDCMRDKLREKERHTKFLY